MADILVWNQSALSELLSGPHGAVAADLAARAIRVESAAKANATHRPGPEVVTGRLRDSISWRLGQDAAGLYADIGSNVQYAIFLELGTVNMIPYPFLRPALSAARL